MDQAAALGGPIPGSENCLVYVLAAQRAHSSCEIINVCVVRSGLPGWDPNVAGALGVEQHFTRTQASRAKFNLGMFFQFPFLSFFLFKKKGSRSHLSNARQQYMMGEAE